MVEILVSSLLAEPFGSLICKGRTAVLVSDTGLLKICFPSPHYSNKRCCWKLTLLGVREARMGHSQGSEEWSQKQQGSAFCKVDPLFKGTSAPLLHKGKLW